MATVVTITCDHCGNKITKPNKFMFGPKTVYDDDDDEEEIPRGKRGRTSFATKPKIIKREQIDLCDSCADIWMDRVRNLTKASDPD